MWHCRLNSHQDNIIFGSAFDEERYNKVIKQCGLESDLSLFEAGDRTEVGEKGLTLSGGQKARITLARAVYSQAEIVILDDVLAALECVRRGRWHGDPVTDSALYAVSIPPSGSWRIASKAILSRTARSFWW